MGAGRGLQIKPSKQNGDFGGHEMPQTHAPQYAICVSPAPPCSMLNLANHSKGAIFKHGVRGFANFGFVWNA